MADITGTDQEPNLEPVVDPSAENPVIEPSGVSPAPSDEVTQRLRALEEQYQREKDRNDLLEQSLRIQERYLQQQQVTRQPVQPQPEPVSQEMEILEKALAPILDKRMREAVEPLGTGYGQLIEENDAMRFDSFLQRNNPELLEDEDQYNKTLQQIDTIRQAARQRGMNVSRVDAFIFNNGVQETKQKVTQRKNKRSANVASESRRLAEVAAATNTNSDTATPRIAVNAGINAIREKAARGDRLSQEERNKLRDFVGNVEL